MKLKQGHLKGREYAEIIPFSSVSLQSPAIWLGFFCSWSELCPSFQSTPGPPSPTYRITIQDPARSEEYEQKTDLAGGEFIIQGATSALKLPGNAPPPSATH
jgi:hypothetical protein